MNGPIAEVLVGSEELARRVDDLGDLKALGEKPHATIDFAQPFLAVVVVAIFRAVPVGCSP